MDTQTKKNGLKMFDQDTVILPTGSIKDIANELGVSSTAVGKVLRGETKSQRIKMKVLHRLEELERIIPLWKSLMS